MIRIDLEAGSLRAALDAVTARAQDVTPLMQDLAQVMAEQTRRRFQESRGAVQVAVVQSGARRGSTGPAIGAGVRRLQTMRSTRRLMDGEPLSAQADKVPLT